MRVTAAVAYVHSQKARAELIAKTTDFQLTIGIGKVGMVVEGLGSKE